MITDQAYFDALRELAPEMALALAAFFALFSDVVFGRRDSGRAGWITLAALGVVGTLLMVRGRTEAKTVFALLEVDHFAAFFQLLMTAGCAVVVLLWMQGPRGRRPVSAETCFFLLSALLGGFLMVGTKHALMLVLGFEVLSLSSAALVGTGGSRLANGEASMKFLVFSCFSSALMIYGVSLLYGLTGTLDFARMGAVEVTGGTPSLSQHLGGDPLPVAIALVLVLAGFAGKIALAPLHFWAPDVGEAAPAPLGSYLVVVMKVAGFGALLRFLSALFVQDHVTRALLVYSNRFGTLLAILAALTMAIGSLAALRQAGLRRLFAYSAVAHTGFAMVGVACLDETGFSAALVYLAISTLMHAGAFASLTCCEHAAGSDRLDDLRGLGVRSPLLGVAMILLLAGLTGLAPMAGFYGKLRVFIEAWNAGLGWLVLVGAITTAISAFGYLRVARALYFVAPSQAPLPPARILVAFTLILALAALLFGLWPRPLDQWATYAMDLLRG